MNSHLVTDNQGLVHWQAKRYAWCGIPHEDLVQEGNLGLLRAIEKYETGHGTKFSTYATWWIRQRISRAAYSVKRHTSLDEEFGEGGTRRVDLVSGVVDEVPEVAPPFARRVLCCLTPREERVLGRRFGIRAV